ncbi:MAG: hypothetical protein HGA16_00625 [Candidatus Moranbacteria bacterium]|nr:hypothetical protein [Candidatus Moranbacteria bacterium]
MDEVQLRRSVNDRYGNFPGRVQDEMVGIIRDFQERISSNPGGHLVIRTERDTSRTTEGIKGLFGSSQLIPGSEKTWLIGTITGKSNLLGGETLSLVLEHLLEGECVCIPHHGHGIEYAAMPPDQAIVSRIAQKYLDISVLLLESVCENESRLKEEWKDYRGTQAELLVGDREIGAWLDNPRNDTLKLFELISLLGWTLECDSEQYQELVKRQRKLDEFEPRYQAESQHIEAVAELLRTIEADPALYSYRARLRLDLGIKR